MPAGDIAGDMPLFSIKLEEVQFSTLFATRQQPLQAPPPLG